MSRAAVGRMTAFTFQGQHAHVHTGQFAPGHLQVLQGVRETGGQGVVLLGEDGKFLFGLLYISGSNRGEGG